MEDSSKKSKIIDSAPGFLKDILPYISPRVFDLIDIPTVALNMGKISYQYMFSKGIERGKSSLEKFLPSVVSFSSIDGDSLSNKEKGEAILELYFLQVLVGKTIFLDLRPGRFKEETGGLIWSPNGLHCDFKNDFQTGLVNLYSGFYQNDQDSYEKGLAQIGLISESDTQEERAEMMRIFNDHFGDGDQEAVKFEMKHFVDSFHQIFDRIFHQHKKLSEDFVYLGIYLVTLYLNLEKNGEALNVRAAFNRAYQKIK